MKDVTVTVDVAWVDDRSGSDALEGASNFPAPATADDILRVEHLAKRFGEVVALRDIDLHLGRGEALGLIGDNASGKSTLIKIIAGFQAPDAGRIVLRGAPVALKGVDHARSLGIDCVYQDLALVDQLSVWENIFLRRETVRRPVPLLARRQMRAEARAALDQLGVDVASMDVPVGRLSGGQRQAIAIARGMRSAAEILLLDEPIAAMGAKESAVILDVIARVREQTSVSIVLVAHNYVDVMELCDRVNVIEDGSIALDAKTSEISVAQLTSRMMAPVRASWPMPRLCGEPRLHAVEERVHRGRTALGPVREAVPARAAVVCGHVDRARRTALDHARLDAHALQRTVVERSGDGRSRLLALQDAA